MSTSYYLRMTSPLKLFAERRVGRSSNGAIMFPLSWVDDEDLVNEAGEHVTNMHAPEFVTDPKTLDDLRALVESGKYEIRDEYNEPVDVDWFIREASK